MNISMLLNKDNRKTTAIGVLIAANTIATIFGMGLPSDVFNGVMTAVGLAVARDGT